MFSLASHRINGRRILVIEDVSQTAAELRHAIMAQGGTALGPTGNIDEALCYIATVGKVDCVMLDTRMAVATTRIVPALFEERGVETIFVTGHDDWFDEDDDDDDDVGYRPALILASA